MNTPFSAPQPGPWAADPLLLSIVSPCYNEAGCVRELHRRVTDAARLVAGESFEVVLVNDGSRDGTLSVLRELAAIDPKLVVVNLSRNFGHQSALSAGLFQARGERILVIDADLQDPPELLVDMMRLMDEGADVVYGQRRSREGETRFKTATARLFYRGLGRLADVPIPHDTGDFRLMNRRTLEVFKAFPEQFRFIRGLVSWIGGRQVPMIYDRDPRLAGETNYPFRKMLRFAVDAVTGFSIVPLRLASLAGIVMGGVSVMLLLYTIGSWMFGNVVAGWTSLACIMLVIGSVQLLVLGVLGEYIGRLYIESKRRPLFVIQEVIGGTDAARWPHS